MTFSKKWTQMWPSVTLYISFTHANCHTQNRNIKVWLESTSYWHRERKHGECKYPVVSNSNLHTKHQRRLLVDPGAPLDTLALTKLLLLCWTGCIPNLMRSTCNVKSLEHTTPQDKNKNLHEWIDSTVLTASPQTSTWTHSESSTWWRRTEMKEEEEEGRQRIINILNIHTPQGFGINK